MHGIATSADGTRIAYQRCGEGAPTLIVVTGALQYRGVDPVLEELARGLSDSLSVVIYDRRGRGESCDTAPYAVDREIEDIAALIALRGGEVSLFGHSSGGVLAVEAALAGLPISRLALYEPPLADPARPDARPAQGTQPDGYADRLDTTLSDGRLEDALVLFLSEGMGMPTRAVDAMKASPDWVRLVSVAPTLPYDHAVMDRTAGDAVSTRWSQVEQPALVLSGGMTAGPMAVGADIASRALPRSEHRSLTGQHHGFAAGAIAPVLREWFVPVAA